MRRERTEQETTSRLVDETKQNNTKNNKKNLMVAITVLQVEATKSHKFACSVRRGKRRERKGGDRRAIASARTHRQAAN